MSSPESATDTLHHTDEALVERLRAGDGEVFAEAVRPHQAMLLRLAGRFVPTVEDAEDVVQEAVVEGFHRVRRFRGEASLGTWLGRIVIRKAMRASRRGRTAAGKNARATERREAEAPDEAGRIAVRDAVARLPAKLRAPVVLRFYEGLSGDEIAELLDCKPSTVWTRLYRGLKRLREDLGEEALP